MAAVVSHPIGRYRLLGRLGAGGMGEVFLAEDPNVGRRVAIKVLTASRSPEFGLRFRNEARIHQKLYHPNIATLFESVETSSGLALVMEYVGGPALMDWAEGPPRRDWAERLAAFVAIARAVGYLHANGIVHRDIKPENVRMAEDGSPKLLDFGIARDAGTPSLTITGSYVGTIQYSAPERLAGKAADARCDVWSLGILLYELLSGQAPFDGDTLTVLLTRIQKGRHPPLRDVCTGLPEDVDALIRQSVAVDCADRFESAGALAVAAEDVLFRVTGQTDGRGRPARRWPRLVLAVLSHPAWRFTLLGLVAALGVAVAVIMFLGDGDDQQPAAMIPAIRQTEPAPPANTGEKVPEARPETATQGRPGEPAQTLVRVHIGGLTGTRALYNRAGEKIGTTPYTIEVPFGSPVWIQCRRDGLAAGPPLEFRAGMNNTYTCPE